ncbi:hypothetical protein SAMN05216388_1005138 [Halorientalis persicus]|jgi:hypothetical protein|uniref:DUF7969 domain-containing protein n=1 Tax=Halorientalis persicus TaxID=1367881 RepID=A0A1H8JP24_9EURY|nr:hypothetical protein [Halorientalis persicus]SEN82494.1 hypothetical protein SAMN05216388_1005138 [Halorientalis persicus]
MVEVTYHCPYCGAVTGVEREGYLDDDCVTREPLDGWEYASTTDDVADREAADGIEFVCLGDAGDGTAVGPGGPARTASGGSSDRRSDGGANDPDPEKDGCGRTFYLSFRKSEDGERVEHRTPDIDRPRFDFRP